MIEDLEDIIKSYDKEEKLNYDENLLINLINYLINWIDEEIIKKSEKEVLQKLKTRISFVIQKFLKPFKIQIKKPILLYYYRKFISEKKVNEHSLLIHLLIKKPANDISGINQITILTSPNPDGQNFSCKHDCFYCPNEPAHEDNNWTPQPRSYLSKEPAVQRANRNNFDPYLQTKNRLDSLLLCGHKCDKLEFIIEGGTFTEYPKKYLKNYFKRFIYCVNTYFDKNKRDMYSLDKEIMYNKYAKCRIIGICIETRPDAILGNDEEGIPWIKNLLHWGVTRIQLGLQQIDNFILKKINRGHTIEEAINAIKICKNNCFKIDIHLMPDLPYSSPEKDKHMFDEIYNSDKYQPDQIKIYPCEVVPWTKIEKWYQDGTYIPYGKNKEIMSDVLKYAMINCPPYMRLPRVVRDIPTTYISGGIKCGNLRQEINQTIESTNCYSMDIRYREIERHPEYSIQDAELVVRNYEASDGMEYFISFESYDYKAIYGFLRLRIPNNFNENEITFYPTLNKKGLIREIHVYGSVQKVYSKNQHQVQHSGFGTKMLQKAEEIAFFKGMHGLAVISGIGVREYYEKKGYTLENNYMIKLFFIYKYKELIWYYIETLVMYTLIFAYLHVCVYQKN